MSTVTSSQLFYGKLNEANPNLPYPLDETNIVVGTPGSNANGGISKNSQVVISGAVGSKYSGTATAYYDRVALADIIATVSPAVTVFPLTTETKVSDVLPVFNQTYNVNIVAADIIDGSLPSADPTTGQVAFTLAIAPTSLAFSGSAALVYQPSDISLATFTTSVLDGMTVAYINLRQYSPDQQMLLSLVNADNTSVGRLLSSSNTTTSTPIALTSDPSGKNTSATITGTAGLGFKDSLVVYYNRVALTDIIAASGKSNTVPNTGQVSQQDMINSFNAQYSSNLKLSDVEAASIATQGGGFMGITLTPMDGHYLYNGPATIQFAASWPTLTLTGTLTTAGSISVAYSSSLTVAGGDGEYTNAVLGAGTLPPGLSLSVDGSTVVLSGTPTTAGIYNFTVKVSSTDGQTATSTTQTVGVTASLVTALTLTVLDGLTTTDVTT